MFGDDAFAPRHTHNHGESGQFVENGISLYARDGENSNSAVLCEVYPADFYDGILGGAELQRDVERAAFRLGGGDYKAPVQTVKDFFDGRRSERLYGVKPTYSRGFELSDLNEGIPRFISDNLKTGIKDMGAKLKGFDSGEAVLTGYETRSSSPVRILRGDNAESVSVENLFPCGEGCGYAGGIMSAAAERAKPSVAIPAEPFTASGDLVVFATPLYLSVFFAASPANSGQTSNPSNSFISEEIFFVARISFTPKE